MGDPPTPSTWCCELGSVQDPLMGHAWISGSWTDPSWNIWFVTAWLWPLTWLTVLRLSGCFFLFCEALCNFILSSKIQMNKSHDLTWGFTLFLPPTMRPLSCLRACAACERHVLVFFTLAVPCRKHKKHILWTKKEASKGFSINSSLFS